MSKNKSPPPAAEPVAPAPSGGWKNKFGPPPPRTSVAAEPAPKAPSPPPPEPEPQEEEAAHGEWADVLYDYNSGEATDLVITAGERVLVTERTSDDWYVLDSLLISWEIDGVCHAMCYRWTGKFNGKSGLFPATYVQLL
ncbi:hypothetical protein DXG03_006563 [Asterophora parasitica]|uniref:SH3 domain-containing protein n=1 Tax=Asterophora parasitica TaxID=117018 RepID=A0A9P7G8M8_9AGAR|nr:hypothetical protein DXG03_006563 [Asterophora parasitica]